MKLLDKPWKHDVRSKAFSHEKLFGSTKIFDDTLGRIRTVPFNQGQSTRCTGYGSAANGGYIWNQYFSPDYQAYLIGTVQGKTVDDNNGGDPNATMKAECLYGFLPLSEAPFSLEKNGIEGSGLRAGWPISLQTESKDYRGEGFVKVDGPNDIFDNIRSALQLAWNPTTKKGACVQAFGAWYQEWANGFNTSGVIPTTYSSLAGYHHYIFIDWIDINGITYLIAQNSYGTASGDKGFFYFPREVVNREFVPASFFPTGRSLKILKTLTKEQIERAKEETPFGSLQRAIINAWYSITLILVNKYGF